MFCRLAELLAEWLALIKKAGNGYAAIMSEHDVRNHKVMTHGKIPYITVKASRRPPCQLLAKEMESSIEALPYVAPPHIAVPITHCNHFRLQP